MAKKQKKTYRSESLSIDEQERLLAATESLEDYVLFKLALETGIRREDIVRVEIGNIDFENRKLRFWQEKKDNFHELPLTEGMCQDLKRYIAAKPKTKETPKQKKHPQKFLFTFTGRTAYNKLAATLEKAKIAKKLRFHDLRRSFVKTAKKKGLTVKAVAQILDDRYTTVEEHYANLDMEELKEEIDKLQGESK